MATVTKSPALTSISPLSFLNSSIGMKLSDLSPALTTTTLKSTRTTSAVMSSPWRISCRVRDSSNSAAKFSIGGAEAAGVMLEMAVAMGVGSFTLSRPPTARTLFLARRAGCRIRSARRLKRSRTAFRARPGTAPVPPVTANGRTRPRALRRTTRSRCLEPVEHEADCGGDRHAGGIQDHGVRRGRQRGHGPSGIPRVALPDIAQKTFKCTGDSFFDQLLMPPPRPFLRARRHEHLEPGVGKDHGAHVAPVGDQARAAGGTRAAARAAPPARRRMDGDLRSRRADVLAADRRRRRPGRRGGSARRRRRRRAAGDRRERAGGVESDSRLRSPSAPPAGRAHPLSSRWKPSARATPAAIVPLPEAAGPSTAITGTGRPLIGISTVRQAPRNSRERSCARNRDRAIRTATPPSAASEKHIAIR